MNILRTAATLALALGLGCSALASSPRTAQERLGDELVTAAPGRSTVRGWKSEIWPEQATIERMQLTAQARDTPLLAAAFLTTNFHSYYAVAFLRADQQVQAVETAITWGKVQAKWAATVTPEALEAFIRSSEGVLECTSGDGLESTQEARLVYWHPSRGPMVCSGSVFSEESAAFGELLNTLLPSSPQTYSRSP